jgi:uracil-DNA glycosylase family 4
MNLCELNERIIRCRKCPRLVAHREEVAKLKRRQYQDWEYWGRPLPGFGDPDAQLLVLGLAPAAHGGNRTGRVFTGDRSGDWLYEALHQFGFANQPDSQHRDDGLKLENCYIAAAARCAPPGNKPTPREFDQCRDFLIQELRLLKRLRIVLVLGKLAFDQYLKTCEIMGQPLASPVPRFAHAALYRLPWKVTLLCSYHPSQQNTFTGKLTRRMFHSVFRKAHEELETSVKR